MVGAGLNIATQSHSAVANRRLIVVNGDDFGFSSGVNRAIIEAHQRGILTSASLMVTGAASSEAVGLARSNPSLAVGLHLVLICGTPALPPSEIPHLVDANGKFSNDPFQAGVRYYFSSRARVELRTEIRAQLQKFLETGLTLSHVDGHLHMHSHPVVFHTLVELADEFNIQVIRAPREELIPTLKFDRTSLPLKTVWYSVFRCLHAYASRKLKRAGIESADRVYGLLQSGNMTEDYLLQLLPRVKGRRVEIYSHPARPIQDEPLNGPPGAGMAELEALLSARVRQAIEDSGLVLGNFNHAEELALN